LEKPETLLEEADRESEGMGKKETNYDVIVPECTNKKLLEGWFDFDDSTVSALRAGVLHKQFGGSDCAYMLMYRKRSINTEIM